MTWLENYHRNSPLIEKYEREIGCKVVMMLTPDSWARIHCTPMKGAKKCRIWLSKDDRVPAILCEVLDWSQMRMMTEQEVKQYQEARQAAKQLIKEAEGARLERFKQKRLRAKEIEAVRKGPACG